MNYIGIDIGGTNLKAGLVNDEGSILAMEKRKIAEVSDQKALVEALVALTQSLTERGGLTPEQIRSVGVGVPGAVEIHSGAVLYTCNLPLRNVPLRKLFHRYLPYPLYVENDANCAALAEYYAGAGKGSKRFVTITLGTGVGAGILHNGQIYHGANGMAGEVGQQGAAAAGMAGALLNIFSFVALIAINLAVMNLLPIPALDGGQILFLLVGGIYHFFTHRRIDQKYLGYINMAGFFCLIALMVVVAVSDVNKLIL